MPTTPAWRWLVAMPLLCTCAHAPEPAGSGDPAARLQALAAEHWEARLRDSPFMATSLGDRRYDAEVPDDSPEAKESQAARWRSELERARLIPEAALSVEDRVTRAMLVRGLEDLLSGRECRQEEWMVNHLGGVAAQILDLPSVQRAGTREDRQRLLARWRKLPGYLDQHAQNLRRGLAAGKTGTADSVGRLLGQLDKVLAQPAADWPLVRPAAQSGLAAGSPERAEFERDLAAAIDAPEGLRAAYGRYRDFLRQQVLPRARPDDKVGLRWVPGGSACYARLVRIHTTLDL
ncbi:MAG TPA: DUF885 family protein, partial [Myxococcales bacterium]|nr:DUF885 family protein [Myxococcales bacterium]